MTDPPHPGQAKPGLEAAANLEGRALDGRYRVSRMLGAGGMGAVYEGEHVALGTRVAIKVLQSNLAAQEKYRQRFLREARTASAIRSDNVVQITDFGMTSDGIVYIVMEFLEGLDLEQVLRRSGPMPWSRAHGLLCKILGALRAAHAKNIIHRDIKAANCFVFDNADKGIVDDLKVLDFGLAKVTVEDDPATRGLTGTGELFGTVSYMAPELVQNQPADVRTDLYAVGVLMYRALVGELPFQAPNAYLVLTQQLNELPPHPLEKNPSIPEAAAMVILKALAKDPADRFQSADEMLSALLAIPAHARGEGQTSVAPAPVAPGPGPSRGPVAARRVVGRGPVAPPFGQPPAVRGAGAPAGRGAAGAPPGRGARAPAVRGPAGAPVGRRQPAGSPGARPGPGAPAGPRPGSTPAGPPAAQGRPRPESPSPGRPSVGRPAAPPLRPPLAKAGAGSAARAAAQPSPGPADPASSRTTTPSTPSPAAVAASPASSAPGSAPRIVAAGPGLGASAASAPGPTVTEPVLESPGPTTAPAASDQRWPQPTDAQSTAAAAQTGSNTVVSDPSASSSGIAASTSGSGDVGDTAVALGSMVGADQLQTNPSFELDARPGPPLRTIAWGLGGAALLAGVAFAAVVWMRGRETPAPEPARTDAIAQVAASDTPDPAPSASSVSSPSEAVVPPESESEPVDEVADAVASGEPAGSAEPKDAVVTGEEPDSIEAAAPEESEIESDEPDETDEPDEPEPATEPKPAASSSTKSKSKPKPKPLTDSRAQRTITRKAKSKCKDAGSVKVTAHVKSTGEASSLSSVSGGTSEGRACVKSLVMSAKFPEGSSRMVKFSLNL